jgi:hypothetical protein
MSKEYQGPPRPTFRSTTAPCSHLPCSSKILQQFILLTWTDVQIDKISFPIDEMYQQKGHKEFREVGV